MIDDKIIKNANLAELYATIPQHLHDLFEVFSAEQQDNNKKEDDDQPPPLIDVSDKDVDNDNEDETNDRDHYLHSDYHHPNQTYSKPPPLIREKKREMNAEEFRRKFNAIPFYRHHVPYKMESKFNIPVTIPKKEQTPSKIELAFKLFDVNEDSMIKFIKIYDVVGKSASFKSIINVACSGLDAKVQEELARVLEFVL